MRQAIFCFIALAALAGWALPVANSQAQDLRTGIVASPRDVAITTAVGTGAGGTLGPAAMVDRASKATTILICAPEPAPHPALRHDVSNPRVYRAASCPARVPGGPSPIRR